MSIARLLQFLYNGEYDVTNENSSYIGQTGTASDFMSLGQILEAGALFGGPHGRSSTSDEYIETSDEYVDTSSEYIETSDDYSETYDRAPQQVHKEMWHIASYYNVFSLKKYISPKLVESMPYDPCEGIRKCRHETTAECKLAGFIDIFELLAGSLHKFPEARRRLVRKLLAISMPAGKKTVTITLLDPDTTAESDSPTIRVLQAKLTGLVQQDGAFAVQLVREYQELLKCGMSRGIWNSTQMQYIREQRWMDE